MPKVKGAGRGKNGRKKALIDRDLVKKVKNGELDMIRAVDTKIALKKKDDTAHKNRANNVGMINEERKMTKFKHRAVLYASNYITI